MRCGRRGAIAMPPLKPGIGIVWTTRPTWAACRRVQRLKRRRAARRAPARGRVHRSDGVTRTMRTSFGPRPAETVHRKRPSGVSAPPVGRLPSVVRLPAGSSLRPLGWMRLSGPITPSSSESCAIA